ncbi:hypothetical protein GDO86_009833 [Hymenochirus boettgeri]|uniref:Protein ripply2 n=1 Tax=Hymenochirus boettgeri TaxID=247094 RepID=A0A8T2JMU3_9PIPI|nr:hypothetical protein GDO86_009833 [Hymenochirus boettgeri]
MDNPSNVPLWRPWHGNCGTHVAVQNVPSTLQLSRVDESHTLHREKPSAFQHPVKLFWPQSRCYDFLYQEAENLLRNFPVQATISLYQETDSDSSSDGEEPLDN